MTEQSPSNFEKFLEIHIRDWFGFLELYFVVERFHPWMAQFNGRSNSFRDGFGVYFIDRAMWEDVA